MGIMQVGVCVQSARLINAGLVPELGLHFIYLSMPSSVYSSPFISIYYLPIYPDQGHKQAQMLFSIIKNYWCPQACWETESLQHRARQSHAMKGLRISFEPSKIWLIIT